jgi:lysophospholipase L1-like esterase
MSKIPMGSFKGPKGDDGDKGDPGDKGDNGLDGANVLPTDQAVAQAATTSGSATKQALDGAYGTKSEVQAKADAANVYSKTDADNRYAPKSALGRILVLGTSIAAAYGATSAATAYPARISANLNTLLGQTYEVVPAGVSGNTTPEMLTRLPALLTTNRPTYVTIEVSVNDTRLDRSVTTAQTMTNLRKMIALTRLAGAIPVLITAAPFDSAWFNNPVGYDFTSVTKATVTNAAARSLATELDVALVDLWPALLGKVGILNDGLHPNDTGHNLWGLLIATKIAQMVAVDQHTVRALDEFNRPDDPASLETATTGGTWTALQGTWGIVGGDAEPTSNTAIQYAAASLAVGQTSLYTETSVVGSAGCGLIARVTDNNNYYLCEMGTDRRIRFYKRVSGAFTLLQLAPPTFTVADGDSFGFAVDGTHLTAFIKGIPVAGVTDAAIAAGSSAGIWNGGALLANAYRMGRFVATT